MKEKEVKYSQVIKRDKSASDALREIYPEEGRAENFSREVTFQLGEACLSGDSLIKISANVEKKISDIQAGDIVLGFDLIENKFVPTEVKLTHQHETSLVVKIETFDTVIYATPEHPFYDMHMNTIKAVDIGKGTMLLCQDGKLKMVQNAELIHKPCTVYNFETTCHTYIADDFITHNCNLCCSYCYQKDKSSARVMTLETGKKIVDLLYRMWDENKPGAFINKDTKMIILDFIGGEPMLYTEVMDGIVSYFWDIAIKRRHVWAETFMISIATNGTLHFKPEVQKFINKYKGHLSYGVSIDGPKEMHDACRVYYDGRGSFDDAYAAQEDYNKKFTAPSGTKATIARANLPYLSTLIKYYVGQGYQQIHANYVYEEEWNNEDAKLLYEQMDEISDYILSLDFPVELSLFDDRYFTPMDEEDNRNWCWGKGTPILTIDGYKPIEEIQVGDLVYTEDGSIHPVINTMSHFANNVVEIKASGQFPLICTDNHKLFAMPLDHVGWKSKLHYKDFGTYEVKDLKPKRDLVEVFTLPIGNIDVDKNVARLVGRFIGDGWMTKTNGASICCGKDELNELVDLFNDANITCSYCDAGSTYQVYPIKSKNKDNFNYNEYMRLSNLCGRLATGKKIPLECYSWNAESLQALLDGYLSADGHINTKKGRAYCSTVSYELANQLLLVLRSLGYGPIVYKQFQPNMEMFGKIRNTHTAYQVSWSLNNKERFYHKIDGKLFTSHLTQKSAEPQTVYNITVDENHSYIAGGYCSSNCGGTGAMVAFDPVGKAYPCIRYMDSSLAGDMPGLVIGDTDGIWDERYKDVTDAMNAVTRRSQSTDECFYCPIASGCSWCSGWNYQSEGSFNKRSTRICPMHKARSLASVKHFNKLYLKNGDKKTFHRYLPDEEALKIISQEELDILNDLEEQTKKLAPEGYDQRDYRFCSSC